ncbi:Retrovirus-related Pol polyprotein from transposon TNT 1-94 [Sesamum angolense]|uniref:Retrovirus-related Pol polyprotein from transposon TNT 1-94 n=1 Tax=Sesamum angolense TaxID=2727404 RepID=A0AAE1W223_9LAMI|nr:Retrovirus-related Pol polyprotein from transposon TNT 1-94 [Sesamum angolense]
MDSLDSNKVWTLVDPTKCIRPIVCKRVYRRKLEGDRKVATFKAKLVMKGYTLRSGVDFEDTYSLVIIASSIRILLVMTDYYNTQIDVKTSSLNDYFLPNTLGEDSQVAAWIEDDGKTWKEDLVRRIS